MSPNTLVQIVQLIDNIYSTYIYGINVAVSYFDIIDNTEMHDGTHAEMTWITYPAQTIDGNSSDVKAAQRHTLRQL